MLDRFMTEAPAGLLGQTLLATKTDRTFTEIEAQRPYSYQDLQTVCSGRLCLTERRLGLCPRLHEPTGGCLTLTRRGHPHMR